MTSTFNPAIIAERCGWNIECISNSLAAILISFARQGKAPRDLVERTFLKEHSECQEDSCRLNIELDESSLRDLVKTYVSIFESAYRTVLSKARPEEISKILQFLIDNELDEVAQIVDSSTDVNNINAPAALRAQIVEQIATLLYASGNYERARERFAEASRLYEETGLGERALFMRAFSLLSEAELLKERASKLHEENRHVEEEELIKQVSKIYAETSILFRQAGHAIPEAFINAILSRCDACEVLANFYFAHGQVEEAEKYYTMCYTSLREERTGVSEAYIKLIEYKEITCRAFAKLCRAIIEGKSQLYEEAGDDFRRLVQERYLEDVMVEMATIAYRSAIETAESLDDVLRVYPKYLDLVILYIDRRVEEKYGDFKSFLQDFRMRPISALSRELRVDEYALKMYIAGKLLREIANRENIPSSTVLELLTLVAGLNLDPLGVTSTELKLELSRRGIEVSPEILNLMCSLLDKLNRRIKEITLGVM